MDKLFFIFQKEKEIFTQQHLVDYIEQYYNLWKDNKKEYKNSFLFSSIFKIKQKKECVEGEIPYQIRSYIPNQPIPDTIINSELYVNTYRLPKTKLIKKESQVYEIFCHWLFWQLQIAPKNIIDHIHFNMTSELFNHTITYVQNTGSVHDDDHHNHFIYFNNQLMYMDYYQ